MGSLSYIIPPPQCQSQWMKHNCILLHGRVDTYCQNSVEDPSPTLCVAVCRWHVVSWHSDSLPLTGNRLSPTLAQTLSHCHSPFVSPQNIPTHCIDWLFPFYYTTALWGQRAPTEVCPGVFSQSVFSYSSRTYGSRWTTSRHAATGGLGGLSFCPSSGGVWLRTARCHAGQDGSQQCSHEAQQPARAPAAASVPNNGQWWEPAVLWKHGLLSISKSEIRQSVCVYRRFHIDPTQ